MLSCRCLRPFGCGGSGVKDVTENGGEDDTVAARFLPFGCCVGLLEPLVRLDDGSEPSNCRGAVRLAAKSARCSADRSGICARATLLRRALVSGYAEKRGSSGVPGGISSGSGLGRSPCVEPARRVGDRGGYNPEGVDGKDR